MSIRPLLLEPEVEATDHWLLPLEDQDDFRRQRRDGSRAEDDPVIMTEEGCEESHEHHLAAQEYLGYLLNGLEFEEKYVILLHFMDGYDWQEIQKVTEYTIEEVRRYAMAAIRKLRQRAQETGLLVN